MDHPLNIWLHAHPGHPLQPVETLQRGFKSPALEVPDAVAQVRMSDPDTDDIRFPPRQRACVVQPAAEQRSTGLANTARPKAGSGKVGMGTLGIRPKEECRKFTA